MSAVLQTALYHVSLQQQISVGESCHGGEDVNGPGSNCLGLFSCSTFFFLSKRSLVTHDYVDRRFYMICFKALTYIRRTN